MWKYIRRYLPYAVLAALFMVGEVMMDLLQPEIMSRIVDDGVLGLDSGGVGDLGLIWTLGLQMIGLVLFGGLCGSLNNVFVHMSGQNIGNEIRKDAFRRIMTFSFPQLDRFGPGSLVTRVTNDITQVQNLVSQFVRGMIRTSMLTFGSMYFMFRLNRDFGLAVLCAFPFLVWCMAFCLHRANPMFSRLQEQLDSPVAERGMSLSGGQKQRLSIARAVVKGAEILIFDDSTSALDLKTEAELYRALEESCPETTKIIVAQRLASVRRADRIVVLDGGRVAAVGTHEQLLAGCGVYQDICRSQMGEEEDELAR